MAASQVRNNDCYSYYSSCYKIKQAFIPCLYEKKRGGCYNPNCKYLHQQLKSNIHSKTGSQGLILPTISSSTSSPSSSEEVDSVSSLAFSIGESEENPVNNFLTKSSEQNQIDNIIKESDVYYKKDDATGTVIPSNSPPGVD